MQIQSHPCGLNEFCHHTKVVDQNGLLEQSPESEGGGKSPSDRDQRES